MATVKYHGKIKTFDITKKNLNADKIINEKI